MKREEVLFQEPAHQKKIDKKCEISVPGICPKFGEWGPFERTWSKMEKII